VIDRAEKGWAKIVPLLGADRAPKERLVIRLEGDAKDGQIPTVDPASRTLLLYRLQGPGGDYSASLVHELVHVFRWPVWSTPKLQTDSLVYLEEALAELVAVEAGFPSQGFPTYGTPLAVVAGAWLATAEDLPVDVLIRRHKELNFRCMAQAYGLRLAFATWVRERTGLAALVRLANSDEPLTPTDLEKAFGGSLSSLASEWKTAALASFAALPDAQQQATRYRRETPIRYFNVCGAGELAQTPQPTR
jgi:hypothetical protein